MYRSLWLLAAFALLSCGGGDSAPSIHIASPQQGAAVSGTVLVAGVTSGDVSIVLVDCGTGSYSVASGAGSGGWSYGCNTDAMPEGPATFTAKAVSPSGEEARASADVTIVNTTDPIVGSWDWTPGSNVGGPGQFIVFTRTGGFDQSNGPILDFFPSSWTRESATSITIYRGGFAGPVIVRAVISADRNNLELRWTLNGLNYASFWRRRGT